jgi:SOS-response transcriptional repressor LexA
MDAIADKIAHLMDLLGLPNQAALAAKLGVGADAVSGWATGKHRPGRGMQIEIARLIDQPAPVVLAWFKGKGDLLPITNGRQPSQLSRPANWPAGKIPKVGHIPGNGNSQGISDFTQYGSWPEDFVDQGDIAGSNSISAVVKGDSMKPALLDGTQVIADPDADLIDGCIVIVQFNQARNEQNTVKRYFDLGNGRMRLVADNGRDHKPIEVGREDVVWIGRCVEKRERL